MNDWILIKKLKPTTEHLTKELHTSYGAEDQKHQETTEPHNTPDKLTPTPPYTIINENRKVDTPITTEISIN